MKLCLQKPDYTFKRVSMMSCSDAQRQRWTYSTALHRGAHIHSRCCLSVVSVCWLCSPLKHFHSHHIHLGNPGNEKEKIKTISGITFTKHLFYLNGNICSCLNRKYFISCHWGRWKSSQRLWKANWKRHHNVMFRKYTLLMKTWSITCTKAAVSPVRHAH